MHPNLINDEAGITELLANTHRVAVLGIKTEAQADQPAFYVPEYLVEHGLEIFPVPVYYPEATSILGREVHRRLVDVPQPIDMVDVFRRAKDLAAHFDDLVAAKPKSVWLQQGIRNQAFAERLAEEGIKVVQDHCLMVELKLRA